MLKNNRRLWGGSQGFYERDDPAVAYRIILIRTTTATTNTAAFSPDPLALPIQIHLQTPVLHETDFRIQNRVSDTGNNSKN